MNDSFQNLKLNFSKHLVKSIFQLKNRPSDLYQSIEQISMRIIFAQLRNVCCTSI